MSTLKTINVQHPSASTTNIVNDASGNVAVGNNLTVAGTSTISGNETVTGTLTVGGVAVVAAAPTATGNIPFSTNGTTWSSTAKIVQGTSQASTSGTSIDFTGIPSWVKRVTVMLYGVSTNGSNFPLFQLGSGSVQITGYVATGSNLQNAIIVGITSSTAGIPIYQNTASEAVYGSICFTLIGSNIWTASGNFGCTSGNVLLANSAGGVTLSGALDRVRITTVGGTDTFDAGSINILYE